MVQTHTVWRVPAEAGVGLFLRTLTVLPGVSQGQNLVRKMGPTLSSALLCHCLSRQTEAKAKAYNVSMVNNHCRNLPGDRPRKTGARRLHSDSIIHNKIRKSLPVESVTH